MEKLWQTLRQLLKSLSLKKEQSVESNQEPFMYTEEQLMARLKFFIGICLALTLVGIVFVVLYSLIFVTQPMGAIAPIDSKFFELIIPIATFLTGTLSGIMLAGNDKDLRGKAIDAASGVNKPGTPPSSPSTPSLADSAPKVMPPPPRPAPPPPPSAAKKEDDGELL
jgi:hypothetical protein